MMRLFARSRFLVALLLLAMVAVPMAAGGFASGVHAQEKTKITFWNYWDGDNGKAMQKLVDQYNAANPNVEVDNVFIGFNDLLPKLQAAAAGGDSPDVAAGDLIWMPKLAKSGAVVALDDYISAAKTDLTDIYPALLNAGKYEGKTYSLPVSTNNLELFYNQDLFTKAGLDPTKPPTTWDELRADAKQCADASQGVSGMELYTEPGEGLTWQFQVYLWQAGGDFLSPDLTKAAFNSPAGEKALQFWVDLLQTDKSASTAPWGEFGQGKSCMAMDGSWMVGSYAAQTAFKVGTAAMPHPADGQAATNMGGEQLVVFKKDAAKQQAAFDFVNWLTSTDTQISWDQQTGFTPIKESVAASSTYLDWVKANQPLLMPFVEQQKNAHNRPPVTNYPEISDAFSREIEAALLGAASPKDALAAAESAVNALLGA
jgi:multiple sugar transport system substrate-binding protein